MDKNFEDLVAQADAADVTGWDFSWLKGRAIEERPPWESWICRRILPLRTHYGADGQRQ